jgi:hypothetical protein
MSGWAKAVGGIAALVAAVWGGIQIDEWYNRPQVKLVASVTFGAVVITPEEDQAAAEASKLRNSDWVAKVPLEASASIRDLAMTLAEITSPSISRGYIRLTVTNDGSQAANDVRLSVPDAVALQWLSAGAKKIQHSEGPTLALGNLPALESIEVTAFMEHEPTWYDVDKIRLTHASGLGKIQGKELDRPSHHAGLWALLWMLGSFLVPLLVLVPYGYWRDQLLARGRAEGAAAAARDRPRT